MSSILDVHCPKCRALPGVGCDELPWPGHPERERELAKYTEPAPNAPLGVWKEHYRLRTKDAEQARSDAEAILTEVRRERDKQRAYSEEHYKMYDEAARKLALSWDELDDVRGALADARAEGWAMVAFASRDLVTAAPYLLAAAERVRLSLRAVPFSRDPALEVLRLADLDLAAAIAAARGDA